MKKKAILALIISLTILPTIFAEKQFGQFDHQFALRGLNEEIQDARQSLHDVYYELLKQGYFDLSYNNNLVLDTSLKENTVNNNQVVLALIDWLLRRNDRDSQFLLKKLNKLYYLELHHFLCQKDLHQKPGARIVSLCQDIYQFSTHTPGLSEEAWEMPFRTYITKIALLISLINHSNMGYYEKKESMIYALGKVKQEMLILNNKIDSIGRIDEAIIKEFIELLSVHAVHIPTMRPNLIKRLIFWSIILSAGCGFAYIIYDKALRKWIITKCKQGGTAMRDWFMEPIGEGVGKGAAKGAYQAMKEISEEHPWLKEMFENEQELKTKINDLIGDGVKRSSKEFLDELAKKNPKIFGFQLLNGNTTTN